MKTFIEEKKKLKKTYSKAEQPAEHEERKEKWK